MSHLTDTGMTYFQHLFRAYKVGLILMVHGLFPNVWQTKASDILNEKE